MSRRSAKPYALERGGERGTHLGIVYLGEGAQESVVLEGLW